MLSTVPKPPLSSVQLRFDRFELDEAEARLLRVGEVVALAPKPFAVLCALARTPRMLVSKNALLDAVWGHRFVSESVLKSAISDVRTALQDDPKQPRYIETVHGRGYRFIAAVTGETARQAPVEAVQRAEAPGRSVQAALTLLCRGDSAVADLIRAVAAALEQEHSPSTEVDGLAIPVMNSFGRAPAGLGFRLSSTSGASHASQSVGAHGV